MIPFIDGRGGYKHGNNNQLNLITECIITMITSGFIVMSDVKDNKIQTAKRVIKIELTTLKITDLYV